jgi:hypothetical protein
LALLASQTTVLNGDLEPVWSPPTTTVPTTTNEDESPAATDVSTTNTTTPITWETDWENVVHDLRGDEELYTYFLANLGGRFAGVSQWNFNALTGVKPPSEVMSVSMEALLLLFLLNYVKVWESQQSSEESSADGGSMSSVSMASVTLYTKQNNSSTKDGWSVEGIRKFQDLKVKVKEDRDSNHGKEFEGRFQRLMKARQLSADQASRKRKHVSATTQLSSITNELSNASSSDEGDN